jgi:hypothetical protein
MYKEWIEIEHTLRFLGNDIDDKKMEYTIDSLKDAVIALMAFKLGWDSNEVFYENMKQQAYKSIDLLKEKWLKIESIQLEDLKCFVNNIL